MTMLVEDARRAGTVSGTVVDCRRHFIGGRWVESTDPSAVRSTNPSTGADLVALPRGTREDVDAAVAAARSAFEGPWRTLPPSERARLMMQLADRVEARLDELRTLDALDMGKPLSRGPATARGAAEVLRYFAGWATKVGGATLPNSRPDQLFSFTTKQPVGVVGAIIPWNGPWTAALWKLGPALAAGCTVILKPSEEASLSTRLLAEIVSDSDLPAGVINVVFGLGTTVGAAMAEHRGIDKISFTGSTATGRLIMKSATVNMKRLTMELGGKSPDIVFADADLDRAVPSAAMGIFGNTGQVCIAGSRIYVQRAVYNDFCERLVDFSGTLAVGDSLDPSTDLGPMVSERQLNVVTSYIAQGVAEGAELVAGGKRLDSPGYYLPPTVFRNAHDSMAISREEIFGPVAAVMPFDDEAEVVARANDTEYGLAGGVWTNDVARALRMSMALDTGTVWVNGYLHTDPGVPLAGVKSSGFGTDLGPEAIEAYTTTKAVWMDMA